MFTTWLSRNLKMSIKRKKNIGKCYLLIRLQISLTTTKNIKKQNTRGTFYFVDFKL